MFLRPGAAEGQNPSLTPGGAQVPRDTPGRPDENRGLPPLARVRVCVGVAVGCPRGALAAVARHTS